MANGIRWRIQLFGGLRLVPEEAAGASPITHFRTQKTGALLAYLAYHLRRQHPREELVQLFWPEDDLDTGRHKLRVALSSLRQLLTTPGSPPEESALRADRSSAGLNPELVTADVTEFDAALEAATASDDPERQEQHLLRAVQLYRGRLLSGIYEEWALQEQAWRAELVLQVLRRLAGLAEARDDL